VYEGELRKVIEKELLAGVYVIRDDSQQKIPLAHHYIALQHLAAFADRPGEICEVIAALCRELHVREDQHVETDSGAIENRDATLDHTGLLEPRDGSPACLPTQDDALT